MHFTFSDGVKNIIVCIKYATIALFHVNYIFSKALKSCQLNFVQVKAITALPITFRRQHIKWHWASFLVNKNRYFKSYHRALHDHRALHSENQIFDRACYQQERKADSVFELNVAQPNFMKTSKTTLHVIIRSFHCLHEVGNSFVIMTNFPLKTKESQ